MRVADLTEVLRRRFDEFVGALEEMVSIDSGTYSPAGVNRMADLCERRFWGGGWQVERLEHTPVEGEQQFGDLVVGRLGADGRSPRILLIGHTDTVFPDGTAEERPFRVEGDRAAGPGVSDMKSGLLGGFFAVEALQELGGPIGNLTYVCNPDEEIGSPFSSSVIRDLASVADVALVLEGARPDGSVVSRRKGVTDINIEVAGRAAHAGIEPEKGRSALLEAARLLLAFQELNGRWPGVTVSVGVLEGGTRSNVIPEHARMAVDLRSPETATLEEAEEEIRRLTASPYTPDVAVTMTACRWHGPMEKSKASGRLVDLAAEVARDLGFNLTDTATGGASDACTTSAAGVPTLDGVGPIGSGDHSPSEAIDLTSIVPRVGLLAGIIARIAERGGI